MTDPYLTLEESQAVMAKGLNPARRAAIGYVHKKLDDADMFEMGVANEVYVKTLTLIAYDLAEQRRELLEALERITDVARRVDGWASFPSDDIEFAEKAIANAGRDE